jgi:LysM repeat protein
MITPARRPRRHRPAVLAFALATALPLALWSDDAASYTRMVTRGETLAKIAITVYGDAKYEPVLAAANGLDAQGGSAIVPGMRLVVPAPGYHRAVPGDTWPDLAERYLADRARAETLARANSGVSWVPPVEGQEVEVPPVIAHIAADGESMPKIAQRYLFDANKAWELEGYNGRKPQVPLARGDVVLVPLLGLTLTTEGDMEARRASCEGGGATHEIQKRTAAELPDLLSHVRGGRWAEAVAHGNRLLGAGDLSRAQQAMVHRALLEAYVALGANGPALAACAAWKSAASPAEVAAKLTVRASSPKIRAVCVAK